jgi:Kef-type K+ transport system membrane component KefB
MNLFLSSAASESPVGARAEEIILHLLYQLILIFIVTRLVVVFTKRVLSQTDVAGEILAGLLLGPSLLGAIWPDLLSKVFDPSTSTIFVGVSQVGLIFLMFQIGLEFEFHSKIATSRHTVVIISLCGILLPFALGYITAPWFYFQMAEPRPSEFGFRLFFAIAMSITAIPVLGRIFMELGLTHTRTATITIAAAAIDDVMGWLLLGIIAAIITANFHPTNLLLRLLGLTSYLLFIFFVARRFLQKLVQKHLAKHGGELQNIGIAWFIIVLFISAIITSKLGVFAVIGGFIIGVALHDNRNFVFEWKHRVAPLVTSFFLPIFFAYTGLRTDIGTLNSSQAFLQCLLVIAIAFTGKLGGTYFASRMLGENNRSALTIGISMNTRGLMELITLNIGYDLGVLPKQMFTMLVIMSIVSTYMATPLIRHLMSSERRIDTPLAQEI